jgi:hypothetical protein
MTASRPRLGSLAWLIVLALMVTGGAAAIHPGVAGPPVHRASLAAPSNALPRTLIASAAGANVDCDRGSRTVDLAAASGNMEPAILAAFDQLGAEGGGTIHLEAGTFTLDQTLSLQSYNNVSIVGAGPTSTIVSMPPDPVGNFHAVNGTPLGEYNLTRNGPVLGTTANLIQLSGSVSIDRFAMCDLTVRAEANNESNAWSGSLIYDGSGGTDHVYANLVETGLFGPGTEPNGLHIAAGPGARTALGYLVDGLNASSNSLPYESFAGANGGSNFLNIGGVRDSTVENVVGTGQAALEVAPCFDCRIENWSVRGHLTVDPKSGGSWGGTVFENVSVNSSGTPASNVVDLMVPGDLGVKADQFSDMSWTGDAFVGTALWGANLVNVTRSSFVGSLNETPSEFTDDRVVYTGHGALPIWVDGAPTGGVSAHLVDDSFDFRSGTNGADAFVEAVPNCVWSRDSFAIDGQSGTALLRVTTGTLSGNSSFEFLNYSAQGDRAAAQLDLIDLATSPTLQNLGVPVGHLGNLTDDLPKSAPLTPSATGPHGSDPTALAVATLSRHARWIIAPHFLAFPYL